FAVDDDVYEIITAPEDFSAVREALETAGYEFLSAQLDRLPQTTATLNEEQQEKFDKMLDMLEDNDDVQEVYHNLDF
ncbi:MAG: YebC/PmpR family DNA-binding transcriptional regulator, partial [Christensenellaceae bacterium]